MGRTYEALQRAERARASTHGSAVGLAASEEFSEWMQEFAALRVAVHGLEDRIERELPALGDELRQALGKAEQAAKEQAAIREGAMEDRLAREITRVRAGLERVDQRVGWLIALAAVATVLALVR